ncbi:hypothetical protein [Streptomyces sp. NBC_01142]|uniref:hypothetical protein n=1 Tax=Streptomyces sp. NBC_01142 TaxID=2975865 RepID=UPI002B1CED5F|nr:hypothetical protein [Streptomyces sp. NBC_01142]
MRTASGPPSSTGRWRGRSAGCPASPRCAPPSTARPPWPARTVARSTPTPTGRTWPPTTCREDGKDSHFPLKEGRGPVAAGELALDARSAAKAGYRVGDTVRFATDGPALTKKLVGIVSTDDPQVTVGGTLTLFDTRTAQ